MHVAFQCNLHSFTYNNNLRYILCIYKYKCKYNFWYLVFLAHIWYYDNPIWYHAFLKAISSTQAHLTSLPLDSRISKHGSKAREFSLLAPHDWEYTTTCQRLRNRERETDRMTEARRQVCRFNICWGLTVCFLFHLALQKARHGIALFLLRAALGIGTCCPASVSHTVSHDQIDYYLK